MVGSGGNQKLFTWAQSILLAVHLEFFFTLEQHDQLVGVVHKIDPLSPRWIYPEITGKPPRPPIRHNPFAIDGCHRISPRRTKPWSMLGNRNQPPRHQDAKRQEP